MKLLIWMIVSVIVIITLAGWLLVRFAFVTTENERGEVHLPSHGPYAPLHETIQSFSQRVQNAPYQTVQILSKDGLKLYGRYYHFRDDAPCIIAFHGYKGHPFFDGCPSYAIAEKMHYNLLLVEQRGHGRSQGKVLTMGVKEKDDCVQWSMWAQKTYPLIPQILFGVSMGAATVMMASDQPVSDNVQAIIADCGYTSVPAILKHCIPQMIPHAQSDLFYPIGRYGARLFAGFDPKKGSAIEALRHKHIPVLLIHGDIDDFVPWQMSIENNDACRSEHQLLMIHNAPHAASFFVDPETYLNHACSFLQKHVSE